MAALALRSREPERVLNSSPRAFGISPTAFEAAEVTTVFRRDVFPSGALDGYCVDASADLDNLDGRYLVTGWRYVGNLEDTVSGSP